MRHFWHFLLREWDAFLRSLSLISQAKIDGHSALYLGKKRNFVLYSYPYTVKKGWRFSRPQPECRHWPNSPWLGIAKSVLSFKHCCSPFDSPHNRLRGNTWFRTPDCLGSDGAGLVVPVRTKDPFEHWGNILKGAFFAVALYFLFCSLLPPTPSPSETKHFLHSTELNQNPIKY